VLFSNANEAWGSFAARRIEMSSGVRFHYDTALMEHWREDTGQEDGGGGPRVLARYPAAVPEGLRNDRTDPFRLLGVAREAAPGPGTVREFGEHGEEAQ
jgi:hypothetical protein